MQRWRLFTRSMATNNGANPVLPATAASKMEGDDFSRLFQRKDAVRRRHWKWAPGSAKNGAVPMPALRATVHRGAAPTSDAGRLSPTTASGTLVQGALKGDVAQG